jgi:palmitoyltransferase
LERDHHCPWVNNCIGLFNKKYFILYNFYAILSVVYSFIIFGYYVLYKHLNYIYDDYIYIICAIVFIIIEIIYASFAWVLLVEQYTNIKQDCNLIDYNSGILLERSTFKQQLLIIFGNKVSLKWILPFFSGGNYDYYVKLCKYINKEKEKEKEKDENEQKIDKYGNKKDKLD